MNLWSQESKRKMHPLWQPVKTLDGRQLFLCHASGEMRMECPPPPAPVQGGILADEMGLGAIPLLLMASAVEFY